eukprot:3444150-Prymnesium_polylepis.1
MHPAAMSTIAIHWLRLRRFENSACGVGRRRSRSRCCTKQPRRSSSTRDHRACGAPGRARPKGAPGSSIWPAAAGRLRHSAT